MAHSCSLLFTSLFLSSHKKFVEGVGIALTYGDSPVPIGDLPRSQKNGEVGQK